MNETKWMYKRKIEVCLEILQETEKAYKVTDDDEHGRYFANWIPKSQVEMDQDGGVGDTVIFTMPEWLAVEKGFV